MRADPRTLPAAPIPSLAPPFALAGFAAGWLAVGVLENPIVFRSYGVHRPGAALLAAVVSGVVGAWLSRSRGPAAAWAPPESVRRLAPPVLGAGAFVALVLALSAEGWTDHTMEAVLFGIVSGVAFLPICRAVVVSAHRSARARLGSLVARADRRAVWSILATCIGVATLVAAIDWPPAREATFAPPWISLGFAGAAMLLVLGARIADARAAARVEALARESQAMDPCDPSCSGARPAQVEVDLGLGEEARARIDHGVAGYRERERPRALLIGSPDKARQALAIAARRGTVCCATLALVLGAHLLATRDPFAFLYHLHRCDQMSGYACAEAAQLADGEEQSRSLYRRACDGYDWEACEWLAARGLRPPR